MRHRVDDVANSGDRSRGDPSELVNAPRGAGVVRVPHRRLDVPRAEREEHYERRQRSNCAGGEEGDASAWRSAVPEQQGTIDQKAIERALGTTGQMMAGGVFRVSLPRTDLHVTVQGVPLKPAFAKHARTA